MSSLDGLEIRALHALATTLATVTVMTVLTAATAAFVPPPDTDGQLPIVFVHGNGDSAALWQTTIWRFESNGYDPSLLFAVDLVHPSAPREDSVPEQNRSSTTDQAAQLAAAVARVLITTGQEQVVLIGNSRGGNTIRNYVKFGGGHAHTAIAILCGTSNHGIFTSDELRDSEWNARGRFVMRLNAGSEVYPGVRFVTIRSDHNDKYAQPQLPGTDGGVGVPYDGPALAGAENTVLDGLDHREIAYHPRAFREMYRVVTGTEPATVTAIPETSPRLDGMVSGFSNDAPTNLPLAGATVTVYHVDPETGEREGPPVHRRTTNYDGRWGPFVASSAARYEFVIEADGYPITHVYRSPFPRSSRYVHFRLKPVDPADANAGAIVAMSRPRGYYGHGRDTFTIDGKVPDGVAEGVPSTSWVAQHYPARPSRSVRLVFNDEQMTVRTFPAAEGHIVIGEMHY